MGSALAVVTAVTGRWEAPLVTGLQREADVAVVRRCADLADLLATVASGQASAVVVSADLRGLDADAFTRLASARCGVVVLVEPGDVDAAHRLDKLGVRHVLPADRPADEVSRTVLRARSDEDRRCSGHNDALPPSALHASTAGRTVKGSGPTHGSTIDLALSDPRRAARAQPETEPAHRGPDGEGRIVAVWGPVGAPGRTTIAVALAAEFAANLIGEAALLVDADTYGACIGQMLGLLDEAPGLAAAARAADRGVLDVTELARHTPFVAERLRVLTGIARAHRWPELRGTSVDQVLQVSRQLAAWTVVDVGFCLEQDEELAYDTAAPRRNAATLVSLAAADVVVAVGSADPVGLHRLVRGLQDLAEVTDVAPVVVVNRLRAGAVGVPARRQVRDALARFATVRDPVLIPQDQATLDAAVLAGRTLVEQRRARAMRQAIRELMQRVQVGAQQLNPLAQ